MEYTGKHRKDEAPVYRDATPDDLPYELHALRDLIEVPE